MAHSLEVRVPLLGLTLLRFLAPMLARSKPPTKLDIANTMAKRLPDAVLLSPKTGFAVPAGEWLLEHDPANRERGLRGWARWILADWTTISCSPRPAASPPVPPATSAGRTRGVRGISTAGPRQLGLLATEVCSFGGIQAYMKRIIEVMSGLEKAGEAKCVCISLNDPMPVDESFETGNGKIGFIGAARSKLRYVWQSYTNAQPSMTMLVGHLNLAPVAWLLRSIGRISSYVVIVHGIEAWSRRPWLERISLASADAIIATTKFTATTCAQANDVDQSKFLVIPLCTADRPVAPSTSFVLKGEFKILSVGRQDRSEVYKGYETLIDAVEQLASVHRGVQLHLVGAGNDHARLQALVKQRGLDSLVTMWGKLTDAELEAAYASCDIFALPSKKEGFGIVFLEAMRHGKPCIGGNHGGTPEVIVHDATGFLVEYGDVDQLSLALGVLYKDTARRHLIGAASRARFEKLFTFDAFRRSFIQTLLSDSRRSSSLARTGHVR